MPKKKDKDTNIIWCTAVEVKCHNSTSHKRHRRRHRSSSPSASSVTSHSSSSSSSEPKHKKSKVMKHKKEKKKKKKHHRKSTHSKSEDAEPTAPVELPGDRESNGETQRNYRPMTLEEWTAKQNVVRRVVDPSTGRSRLIKGDGEVLEEIVSREQQRSINKRATLMDGATFQATLASRMHRQ